MAGETSLNRTLTRADPEFNAIISNIAAAYQQTMKDIGNIGAVQLKKQVPQRVV